MAFTAGSRLQDRSGGAAVCFHCGLAAPDGGPWRSSVLGEPRDFCCGGCEAAARAITGSGLEDYYRLRSANAPTVSSKSPAATEALFDREELQETFVRRVGAHREATLRLEEIRCPACLWLNEQRLKSLPGVHEAVVSYPAQSARVVWDPSRIALSGILGAIREIGYRARPIDASHRAGLEAQAARRDAPRLVFALAIGMTVMSLALAAYVLGGPGPNGRLPLWESFGRWCSLFGAAVLLAYPGQDFFAGAWRDLRHRRAGMDVPVALGLSAAWAGSAWATVRGVGPVYFDAIAMLVPAVLLARAYETRARLRSAAALDRLAAVEPATARRVWPDGSEEAVAALDLRPGDRMKIGPGEVVPADGVLLDGRSGFDESVLTGEPWPRLRGPGEAIAAGSFNRDQPVLARVTRVGAASTVGEIRRLVERGLAGRPRAARLADSAGAGLTVAVLALSAASALFWAISDPARALPAAIAVLIVTCPCALALATPVVLTLAAGGLSEMGVVPARLEALEGLARADTVAFDKTGTLTLGSPELSEIETFGGLHRTEALAAAAALEASSLHPIARVLCAEAGGRAAASAVLHDPEGVSGEIGGRSWRLGTLRFAVEPGPAPADLREAAARARRRGRLVAVLAGRAGRAALFAFEERLRPGARDLVARLAREGVRATAILSGDAREPVERVARQVGVDAAESERTPSGKLEWIRARAKAGARVLYVGDGLNDAASLAAAAVSVSFAEAPQLPRFQADFLILGDDLSALSAARRLARRAHRLLVQNLAWALAYNAAAVPLAAAGLVPPWAAALGMSASSLLVVANAMRLRAG
jgi:Cu2+-exporting ATPase